MPARAAPLQQNYFHQQPGFTCLMLICSFAKAQKIPFNKNNFMPNQISMSLEKMKGKPVLRVVKDSTVKAVDEPTFAKLTNMHFHNGTIEVKVLSRILSDAPTYARGFIGVAFRITKTLLIRFDSAVFYGFLH